MQTTSSDFATRFTAYAFLAAAVMLWGGWAALPAHIGTFFRPDDFAAVNEHWWWWVWAFRFHLFGMVVTAMALVSLASLAVHSEARVMIWPGVVIASAGMIVGAVGAAFYYHHGAWGAREMDGKSAQELTAFVEALRVDTEYITCLVRFGRVFSGLGLLFVGWGLNRWRLLPAWVGWLAVGVGLASMAVTMLLPDRMSLYLPIFHVKAVWLALTGATILRRGFPQGQSGD